MSCAGTRSCPYTPTGPAGAPSRPRRQKLSPTERSIFKESCAEARDCQRKLNREEDAKTLVDLKGRGMAINEVAPEAVAQMKQQLKPVTDKYTRELGEDLVQQVQVEIDKVRSAMK